MWQPGWKEGLGENGYMYIIYCWVPLLSTWIYHNIFNWLCPKCSNTLATWCEELTRWKRPWFWERLKAGGQGDNRWDGWMASPTRWTWVWASSGSWWWTGKPGVLQSMGSQSWTRLSDWTELTSLRAPALWKDKPRFKFKLCHLICLCDPKQDTYYLSGSPSVKREYVIDWKNGPNCSAFPVSIHFAMLFSNAL